MIDREGILKIWNERISTHIDQHHKYELSPQLKKMVEMFVPGDFYFWILNFQNFEMEYVHPGVEKILKTDASSFTIQKFFSLLPPDEMAKTQVKEDFVTNFLFTFLDPSELMDYKIVFDLIIKDTDGELKHILHQANTLSVSETGKVQHVMSIHTEVSHLNFSLRDTVSFVNLKGGKSYYYLDPAKKIFDPNNAMVNKSVKNILTKKELQIIQLLAQGKSSSEIASELNKSKNTIDTQRRIILTKTGCKNMNQVMTQCIVEGLVKI